jgi:hypothetical protein
MRKIAFVLLVLISLSCIACAGTPYTRYEPQAVTDNPVGPKVGTAPCSPTGIQEAANSAGITRIATVDIREVYDGKITIREYVVSGE